MRKSYEITEHGLHKALRNLGYTTNSQTKDIVELVFLVLNNSDVTDEDLKQESERLYKIEHSEDILKCTM